MSFQNDAFLWYNAGDWGQFGLAIPNFSDDTRSQNSTIRQLTEVIGRNLQGIMFHTDSRLRTPPSINTLIRIHKLCTRARSLLVGRGVQPATPNMESQHSIPAPEEFLVFPTPYFTVRNTWLKEYAGLILLALTESFQHTENAKPIEISTTFAGTISQYIQRVYRMMSVELFRVPAAEASAADFTLSDVQIQAYDPTKWFTQTELIDTVPPHDLVPTEDDLRPLTDGIAISRLPSNLGRWPSGGPNGAAKLQGQSTAAESSEAFPQPPSP